MRLLRLCALLAVLAATPTVAAAADVPITCKLIDREAAERLLGGKLGPPKFQTVVNCAGVCRLYPGCSFAVVGASNGATGLSMGLDLPLFEGVDYRGVYTAYGNGPAEQQKLPWRGGSALWFFRPPDLAGLSVYLGEPGNICAALDISILGIKDRRKARAIVEQMMRPAVAHLSRATLDDLVLSDWGKPASAYGKWRCVSRFRH